MKRKTFHTAFLMGTVIFILACGLSNNDNPPSSNSSSTTLPSSPTNTTRPLATPTTQLGLTKNWTIKTGDIQYIGVASDGTIYGVGPNLYAVISKDGEVLQTNNVDLTDCLRDNFSGGSGDTEIDRWFVAKPDGTLITTTFIVPCVISPGNPPTVKIIQDGHFFPYADDNIFLETPTTPEGYSG